MRERFVGVWRLVSCKRIWEDGRIDHPFGEDPVGRLTYDASGRMSAQIMMRGRQTTIGPGINLWTACDEEIRQAVGGYAGYFGTFDVDADAQVVVHHVEGALAPSWAGTDMRRGYRFFENRLGLTAVMPGLVAELVWEREPD